MNSKKGQWLVIEESVETAWRAEEVWFDTQEDAIDYAEQIWAVNGCAVVYDPDGEEYIW